MVKNNEMSERNKGRELFGKVLANVEGATSKVLGEVGTREKEKQPSAQIRECTAGQGNLPVSRGIKKLPLCEANPCRQEELGGIFKVRLRYMKQVTR